MTYNALNSSIPKIPHDLSLRHIQSSNQNPEEVLSVTLRKQPVCHPSLAVQKSKNLGPHIILEHQNGILTIISPSELLYVVQNSRKWALAAITCVCVVAEI